MRDAPIHKGSRWAQLSRTQGLLDYAPKRKCNPPGSQLLVHFAKSEVSTIPGGTVRHFLYAG